MVYVGGCPGRKSLATSDLRASLLAGRMPSRVTHARNKNKKKLKKRLTFGLICGILYPVSERKNNEINKMNNEINTEIDGHEVVCCGCGAEVVISLEEVGQWDHGLENYQCRECE